MLNKVQMKEKTEFQTGEQQFKQRNSFDMNQSVNGGHVEENEQDSSCLYSSFIESEEEEIPGAQKIVDINEYKQRNSVFENGEKQMNLTDPEMPAVAYKSRLSKGADNIRLGKALSSDSSRMKGVKIALENYYRLLDEEVEEDDENSEDQEVKNKKAQREVDLTTSLQNIVSTCNKYIANRWPISKEGRKRLSEVKEIRENAIKELGKAAGHPGWRLFGEYLKFGFKAVTSPVWVPAKHTGIYVKRVAKRAGRLVYKKARGFADEMATYFGSWKAAMATIGIGVATLIGGTIMNAINCVLGAGGIALNALCSVVTVPRYLYHLAKGDVKLEANSESEYGRYRAFAVPIPKPHLYTTWFKFVTHRSEPIYDFYFNRQTTKKTNKKKNSSLPVEMIYNRKEALLRYGKNFEYLDLGLASFLGPITDPYYHTNTIRFKKLINFFRYSDKNDIDQIDKRAKLDTDYANFGGDDDDDPMEE